MNAPTHDFIEQVATAAANAAVRRYAETHPRPVHVTQVQAASMLNNTKELEAKVAAGELTKLHTSYVREYVSRKTGSVVRPYKGRFGAGFAVISPNWESSRYSFITYYIS